MYYAHSTNDISRANWQPLLDHLNGTANLAAEFGQRIGIARATHLAGLLHDLGKYTPQFQARLNGAKETVDHSTAGAAIVRQLASEGTIQDKIAAELIAYAISGHHAGLPDKHGEGYSTLSERLAGFSDGALDPIWASQIAPSARNLLPNLDWEPKDRSKFAFQLAFLGHLIFSCLVDADFIDTERFFAGVEGFTSDREWPTLQAILPGLTNSFNRYMNDKRSAATTVNRLQADILDHVRARATEKRGLFTLTVPTGGGKTLASLGFALDHAKTHNLDRIIYAIPFSSVEDRRREQIGTLTPCERIFPDPMLIIPCFRKFIPCFDVWGILRKSTGQQSLL